MADVLDRIRKLIRLALNNPSAEEARSAALKALQLIDAHAVALSLPGAASGLRFHPDAFADAFRDLVNVKPPRRYYNPQATCSHTNTDYDVVRLRVFCKSCGATIDTNAARASRPSET